MVDDEDFDKVNQYRWSKNSSGYGASRIYYKHVLLHRFIMNILDSPEIILDHINGDKLDNRKINLRTCTKAENCRNAIKRSKRKYSSNYKGVSFSKGKYISQIFPNSERKYLGTFNTEVEAAIAYNNAAKLMYGEFALLNDIPKDFKDVVPKRFKPKCSYIGVELKPNGKYAVVIMKNKVRTWLGMFNDPIEAAKAYDAKAKELHGSKAKLNFPDIIDDEVSLLCPELYEESVLNVMNEGSETT